MIEATDKTFECHRGGCCRVQPAWPIRSIDDLRAVYTPGVADLCRAIQADPALADDFTAIRNTVAIVTNGTAVLGLGDIGVTPAMPVMEGKAALFAQFVGIHGVPILLDTRDVDRLIDTLCAIAPSFGAIQLEDIAAPDCFTITRRLEQQLDKPVLHDDQYGTAVVVLAGLYRALQRTGKAIDTLRACVLGAGAAGRAAADMVAHAGVGDIVLCDKQGIISSRSDHPESMKQALLGFSNCDDIDGHLPEAIRGRDLFIGCSGPELVTAEMIATMNAQPIVFALANPVGEISREQALAGGAGLYVDGREMNNALAFPGLFRGALDARAAGFTRNMLSAAAHALADQASGAPLLPDMLDLQTHRAVADAVRQVATLQTIKDTP